MNKDELQLRTKQFALRVFTLVNAMPNSLVARTCSAQLVRCASSVGANYRSACRARSLADFISKLGICEEEADESGFWMELIVESNLIKPGRLKPLHQEASELTRILAKSRITALRRNSQINRKLEIGNRK